MERLTYMSDGYHAVDNKKCYEDQNEDYCGPAIDLLAGYEDTGLLPEELKAKLDRLEILEKAMERLGKFGMLFRDYKGCPRGPKGERGFVPGTPHKHILLEEDPITDVEGDVWIPVLARDLYRYIDKHRWIPVTERTPDLIPCDAGTAYSEAVNVLTSGHKVFTAIWDKHGMIADAEFWEAEEEEITHWTPVLLPLPESDTQPAFPVINAIIDNWDEAEVTEYLENSFGKSLDNRSMTNGDWIRTMPDKELAEFVGITGLCKRIQNEDNVWCMVHGSCLECIEEWLQQPAEVSKWQEE